jgi:Protein of unknown function (DUF1045)
MTVRYAIYYAPEGDLKVAGETALVNTETARRYGFHGTIKAPFRLAGGRDLAELTDRLGTFAARCAPVVVPHLTLTCLGGFFALVAGREAPELQALAAAVVREFDDLRAPLTPAEVARRRPERLDNRERQLLQAYGYPYVLDRFLFHLTLTDPVPAPQQDAVEPVLRRHLAAHLGRDLVIRSLAVFAEPGPAQPFELVSSHPFTKGAP